MTPAVNIMDWHGLSNRAHHECLAKKTSTSHRRRNFNDPMLVTRCSTLVLKVVGICITMHLKLHSDKFGLEQLSTTFITKALQYIGLKFNLYVLLYAFLSDEIFL